MATKRIQDLENVEEVLADSIIPVGEATKTKSMLISQLKNWLSSFFVGISGNQTIDGEKNFLKNIAQIRGDVDTTVIYARDTGADTTKIPTGSVRRRAFRVIDVNGKILGDFRTERTTNGNQISSINVRNGISGSEVNGALSIAVDASGSIHTATPTPPVTDNSVQIANTNWVRQLLFHEVTQEGGYFYLTNDTMIQFGSINTSKGSNVNLPRPFANSNYKVVISGYTTQTAGSANYASIINTTTTGFTVVPANVGSFAWVAIGMK